MRIIFIRHGKTKGNLEQRYVGRTDEPLLADAMQQLSKRKYMPADIIFTSEQIRSKQTAAIIYPNIETISMKCFNEMDFGDFEYLNYSDLADNKVYQAYIDSNGTISFPNGEEIMAFKRRCGEGFIAAFEYVRRKQLHTAAFVIHGGSIMSILEKFAFPRKGYFEWQTENNNGFILEAAYKKKDGQFEIILELTDRIY